MIQPLKGMWSVYCDGSGTHLLDSPACVGVVVVDPDGMIVVESSAFITRGSNNVAELWAVRRALYLLRWATPLRHRTPAVIYSDSQYALAIVKNECSVKANVTLAYELQQQAQKHAGFVAYEHVKGHSGIPGNALADWLAGEARRRVLGQPSRGRPVLDDRLEFVHKRNVPGKGSRSEKIALRRRRAEQAHVDILMLPDDGLPPIGKRGF